MNNRLSIALWRMAYELEEARQRHAERRHHFRHVAACVGLILLRLVGVVR